MRGTNPELASGVPSAAPSEGTISFARVAPDEFRVVASGLWTPDYADAHFGQLKAVMGSARGAGGVRVLVDLRGAAVQTAPTADRVKFWTGSIYEASDRVAMILASSLVRMQMRRVSIIATRELFLDEPEALDWLRAA